MGAKTRDRRSCLFEALENRTLLTTVFTVNDTSDSLNPGAGFLSLREAIALAATTPGANLINFAPSVFSSKAPKIISLTNGAMQIAGDVTISGPGELALTIDAQMMSGIFSIASGSITSLSGFTLTSGSTVSSSGDGAGIYNQGTLTLNGVTVENCASEAGEEASTYGGGVYSTGQLIVIDSNFSNDVVNGGTDGGGAYGGAIYCSGNLSVTTSNFVSDSAYGAFISYEASSAWGEAEGGAIYAAGGLSMTGCQLSSNQAWGGDGDDGYGGGNACGGAIYSTTSTSIAASTISGNQADPGRGWYANDGLGAGGGVYSSAPLTITTSTLSGNTETVQSSDTGYLLEGGAVDALGPCTLSECTISGNSLVGKQPDHLATNCYGGGVAAHGTLTISACTINANSAIGGPGAYFESGTNYSCDPGGIGEGGGIWAKSSAVIVNSTISGNSATGGNGGASNGDLPTMTGNGGNASGGGIFSGTDDLKVFDSTITGNAVTAGMGGVAYADQTPGVNGTEAGGGVGVPPSYSLFQNTIISGNMAGTSTNDLSNVVSPGSSHDLIGVGGGLTNGVNGNRVGINNPLLSPLGDFGGPTQTMVPLLGSPAIDAGKNTLIPAGVTTDQRGFPRIFNTTVDIGAVEFSQVTITGKVYNDLNSNGSLQSNEPGLAGWQVYVDLNDLGYYVTGDPTATTNAAGSYTLNYSPITTSQIIVREVKQNNWRRTQPAGLYPLGFYTLGVTSASAANINFGNSTTALIAGTVFRDLNSSGGLDPGEPGLAGWTVDIDAWNGSTFINNKFTTTTNSAGNYQMVLTPGTYRVRITLKSGFSRTLPGVNGFTMTLGSGATDAGVDFGVH